MRFILMAAAMLLTTLSDASAQPFIYGTSNQVPGLNYANQEQMASFCRRSPKRPICIFKASVIPGTPKMIAPTQPPAYSCKGNGRYINVTNAEQFQIGLQNARPGDTVLLRPGSYGTITVNKGGTRDRHVFIAAQYPAVTTLAMPEAGERSGVAALKLEAPNVTICGLFFESGSSYDSLRSRNTKEDNVTILRNYFNTPVNAGGGVENSIALDKGGSNIVIQSNYFNATRNATEPLDYGMLLYDIDGIIVEGNVFDGVFNRPISTKENVSDATFRGNVFRGCGLACMHVGQQPDYDGKDVTGSRIAITGNTFIEAYTTHPQSRYRMALVLRNQENITVQGNTFQGTWWTTILSDFINRGGLARLADRLLGNFGTKKPQYALIEGNSFTNAILRFTGRGNGQYDRIVLRNNTGSFTCSTDRFQTAEGKRYDMRTINQNPPTVTGCTRR